MFRNPGDEAERTKLKQRQKMYHELLAKDQEKAEELKALQLKSQNEQYGCMLDRKPAKRPDYNDRDYNLNASAESIVRIGENGGSRSENVKALEKEILNENLREAAKRERPPNSPRRAMEKPEQGYFIGSNEGQKVQQKHIMQMKYKTQLDDDVSYKLLNRDKSAFLDIQKAGIVYSLSDNGVETSKKKKEYRDALVEQRMEQEERKRQEKAMDKSERPVMSSYVSSSKYYG